MKLHIKFKVLNNSSAGIINSNRVKTVIKYAGSPVPINQYQRIEKQIAKIETILNQG